jgi:transposase/transposase-like protein
VGRIEGVISLADKQKIIIAAVLEGKTKSQISREVKISRTTVAKYIKDYEQAKSKLAGSDDIKIKEEIVSPPRYDISNRAKVKLTDEIVEQIQLYLKENEEKRATGRSKQQKKKIDILEALKDESYDIGYTTVCNAVRELERKKREAFIKQEYGWGDSSEFDWGEVKLFIAGKLRIIQMGAFVTCKGNYRYGNLYYSQKMENFLHMHTEFFAHVGGVYRETVYDNLRTAVAKFVGRSIKKPTEDLLKLSVYYGFRFRFCNAGQAHEKGRIERSVEYIRRRVFSKKDTFSSLEEAREYLNQELEKLNLRGQVLENGRSSASMLSEEKGYLLPLPPKYDSARVCERRVNKYSVIEIDSCFYSVPDAYVGEFVFVKTYVENILIFYKDGRIAEHKRLYGHFEWSIEIDHYRQTFLKKPGALANSLALLQAAPELRKIYNNYYIGCEKDFIELLEVIAVQGLGKVRQAIDKLEAICPANINTDKIKMIVERNDTVPLKTKDGRIEAYSRLILASYASVFGLSKCEEESII